MERITLEIKEVSEDGTFTGIASAYGVEDLQGDVIDKGAFKKTIAENPNIPILWQHNPEEVIGEGTVKEWQGKIMLDGRLDLEDPTAQKAYQKLKKKLIKGLSIGFKTIKSSWEDVEGRMVRHISELKLWEVSVVTFAALPDAMVTRVKSADEIEKRIKALEEKFAGYHMLPAITVEQCRAAARGEDPQLTDEQKEGLAAFMSLALAVNKATPVEEPAETKEPPQQETTEPDLHSLAQQIKAELKGSFKWN
jgi:HK97 family phage prohead protease